MTSTSHKVGRCLFQLDLPDRTRSEAVFDIVSRVCGQYLPEMMDQVLNTGMQDPENILRIERVVIHLGELDFEDLEGELIRRLKTGLKEIFQETIRQQSLNTVTTDQRLWDALAFFLQSGRFPWWFENEPKQDPESILVEQILTRPAATSTALLQLLRDPVVVQRFTLQFSSQALQAVLQLFFPTDWPQWGQDLEQLIADIAQRAPDGMSEAFLWEIVLRQVVGKNSEPPTLEKLLRALLHASAERSAESRQVFLAQIQSVSERNPLIQKDLNAIIVSENVAAEASVDFEENAVQSPVRALLFFLRQGRLPKNTQLTPDELEQTLLLWLSEAPEQARKILAEISGQARLALRLTQQFSRKSLQAVLQLFFPTDWPQWGPDFEQLIADTAQRAPDGMSEAFLWEIVLRQVLDRNGERPSLESTLRALLHVSAERSAESRQLFLARVHSVSEHNLLIKKALNAIIVSENVAAEASVDFEENAAESPVETLLFFLRQGRLPKNTQLTTDELEQTLLLWLGEAPEQARKILAEISGQARLALRLTQQFSRKALQAVLQLFFPTDWPQWGPDLERLIADTAHQAPDGMSEAFLWEIVLRQVLDRNGERPTLERLLRALLHASAERSAESRQVFLAQIQSVSERNPLIQKDLNAIIVSENVAAEASVDFEENAAESPVETLLFFLRQGRLPKNTQLTPDELEQALLLWLGEAPEQARKTLAEISGQARLGFRLTQQFSRKSLQAVLQLFFPTDWPQWGPDLEQLIADTAHQAPDGMSEAFLWEIVFRQVLDRNGEPPTLERLLRALLHASAERSAESRQLFLARVHSVSEHNLLIKNALNAIIVSENVAAEASVDFEENAAESPVETLLFFLRQGRLPKNTQLTPDELEQALLLWLGEAPEQARKTLAEISGQARLGFRLTQQFSRKSLQAVLQLFFPTDWPQWGPDLEQLIADTAQRTPDGMSEAFLWEIVLRQVLGRNVGPPTLESTLRALLHASAERSAESRQAFLAQIQSVSEHNALIKKALNAIIVSENVAAEASVDFEENAAESPLETLLFFLRQGRFPENSQLTTDELEQTLLLWLSEAPEQARKILAEISGQARLGFRLTQQFSKEALHRMLDLLFPADQVNWFKPSDQLINRLAQLFPDRITEDFLWKEVFQQLIGVAGQPLHPESLLKALMQAIVGRLDVNMDTFQAQIRVAFQDDLRMLSVLDAAYISFEPTKALSPEPEIIGPAAALLFFLREGRMQQGAPWSLVELEQTLLAWLKTDPEQARKELSVINGQVNLGVRLTQQFSQQTQIAVLKTLLSDQWEPFEQLLRDIILAAGRVAPAVFPEDYFWKTALVLAGKQPLPTVNLTTLTQSILQRVKDHGNKTPDIPSLEQAIVSELQKPGYHLFTQKKVLVITGSIQDFERDQLGETISKWHLSWQGLSEENISFDSTQPVEPANVVLSYRAIIEADLAALWQFFQTGALPAGSEISNVGELEQIAFRLLEKHPDITIPFLNKVFERQAATRRLFQYFSPWLYTAMAARLLAPHFETYVAIRAELFKQLDTENKEVLQQHFYTYLFSLIADQHPFPGVPEHFTSGLIRWISNAMGFPEDQIWTHLRWMLEKPDNSMGVLEKILPPLLEQRRKLQKLNTMTDSLESPPFPETENQEEMIVVQNAGLVLIAAFLPRLFNTLNLLENQKFTDIDAAIKSVHLLQFLASGQTETPEQLLVFNKILCGLPVEMPVPLSVDLTEEEQETCMSLLNAVLSNWEIMKNSSVSNLRGAFLLREGILKAQPDRWVLHIERKTFDIVLDYIPWTISMVKLPWMEKRMEIEWRKNS